MSGQGTKNEGIIQPVRGKKEPLLGPDALMVMIPSELQYLIKLTGATEVPFNDMNLYHLYLTHADSEPPIALSGPFLGAPHAVIGMEKLIVLGAKRIWAVGWCGALQPGLSTGNLVLVTGAISEEGTSTHYPIGDMPLESDSRLTRMLEERLEQEGTPFLKGDVWTTDAVYRETREKVRKYQKSGILAVEMEMSALMTLAIYRSVAMAGLLVVSDELSDLKWRPGFSNPVLKKNSRAAGKVLLSLARSLGTRENLNPESL